MKKILFCLVVVILCFSVVTTTAQTSASKINYAGQNLKSAFTGAWQSTDGKEFVMMRVCYDE
jgi:hypothetical protein